MDLWDCQVIEVNRVQQEIKVQLDQVDSQEIMVNKGYKEHKEVLEPLVQLE